MPITKYDKRRAWNEYYKKCTISKRSPTIAPLAGFNEVKEMTFVPNTTERYFIRDKNGFLIKQKQTYLGDDTGNKTNGDGATITSSAIMKLAMVGVISAITTEVIRRAIWKK